MAKAYLLLGSNQGNREYFLTEAAQRISATAGAISATSPIYETAAWGLENQAAFLNQVLQVDTPLLPLDLLKNINQIEQELGRVRKIKYGARVIDIDILYYDDLILDTPELTVPHPRLHQRRFTLIPLIELAPDFTHPVLQQTNQELLRICPDTLEVNLYKSKTPS